MTLLSWTHTPGLSHWLNPCFSSACCKINKRRANIDGSHATPKYTKRDSLEQPQMRKGETMGGGGDNRRGGPGRAKKGGVTWMAGLHCDSTRHRLDTSTKHTALAAWSGEKGPPLPHRWPPPQADRHAPVILRLQELKFLFNPVQGLRDGELKGLACSLVRRLQVTSKGDQGRRYEGEDVKQKSQEERQADGT